MKIDKDLITLLSNCETEGNTLRINEQLDRKTYGRLNKVLTAIGGKWNASRKVHLFNESVSETIENIIATGEYSCIKKDFQFFPTPEKLAWRMTEIAQIQDGETCLEPSAGVGNIAQLMPNCDVIELHEENQKTLKDKGFNLIHDDFLTFNPQKQYDVILMNPPFASGQDVEHCTKAIGLARRCVVAITSAGVLFRKDKRYADFRALVASHGGTMEELPAETFKESGTTVSSCLIVIKKQ